MVGREGTNDHSPSVTEKQTKQHHRLDAGDLASHWRNLSWSFKSLEDFSSKSRGGLAGSGDCVGPEGKHGHVPGAWHQEHGGHHQAENSAFFARSHLSSIEKKYLFSI